MNEVEALHNKIEALHKMSGYYDTAANAVRHFLNKCMEDLPDEEIKQMMAKADLFASEVTRIKILIEALEGDKSYSYYSAELKKHGLTPGVEADKLRGADADTYAFLQRNRRKEK